MAHFSRRTSLFIQTCQLRPTRCHSTAASVSKTAFTGLDASPATASVVDTPTNSPQEKALNPVDPVDSSHSSTPSPPTPKTRSRKTKPRHDKYEGRRKNNALKFLSEIESISSKPTTLDLIKLRPSTVPMNLVKYRDIYSRTYKSIDRTFDRAQIIELGTQLYPLLQSSLSKERTIRELMEYAWGMAPPKERKGAEVAMKDIPISQSQLFLLLGKDGSQLNQLMERFKVQIAPRRSPLALSVRGFPKDIENVAQFLKKLKSSSISASFQPLLKIGLSPDLRQSISKVADAYFETLANGMLRVTTNSPEKVAKARRLALRATFDELQRFQTRFLIPSSDSPTDSPSIAMYPFLPIETPSWTQGDASVFRIRKIGNWFLASNTHVGAPSITPESLKHLREILNKWPLNKSKGLTRSITARTGHILVPSDDSAVSLTLIPPLQGPIETRHVQEWATEKRHRFNFLPSTSIPVETCPEIRQNGSAQRLVYRTIPGGAPRFTSRSGDENLNEPRLPPPQLKHESNCLVVEITIPPAGLQSADTPTRVIAEEGSSQGASASGDGIKEAATGLSEVGITAQEGYETSVNLSLPDHHFDLQFAVFDHYRLLLLPKSLNEYKTNLETFLNSNQDNALQPTIPEIIQYRGRHFYLHTTSMVQRSTEPSGSDMVINQVETIADMDSDASTTSRLMTCHEADKDQNWKDFVFKCDELVRRNS
ncbi:hypothetical protein FRC03_010875 [Tulasnella sp. 419]|nr:hypothetical protein FRC03_010875 [Tulasnella sp. 419]